MATYLQQHLWPSLQCTANQRSKVKCSLFLSLQFLCVGREGVCLLGICTFARFGIRICIWPVGFCAVILYIHYIQHVKKELNFGNLFILLFYNICILSITIKYIWLPCQLGSLEYTDRGVRPYQKGMSWVSHETVSDLGCMEYLFIAITSYSLLT